MRRIILLFAALAGCSFNSSAQDFFPSGKFITLSPQEYLQKLDATADKLVIDVRTAAEYKKGHIKDAQNISYLGSTFAEKASGLDTGKPVFIYCETAHRSPLAARVLYNLGFREIYDLKEGFENWRKENLPVEK